MAEDSLADRIRAEADIADRPGQYDRLHHIADEVDELEPTIHADERDTFMDEITADHAAMTEDRYDAVRARAWDIARKAIPSDITFNETELAAADIGVSAGMLAVLEYFAERGQRA